MARSYFHYEVKLNRRSACAADSHLYPQQTCAPFRPNDKTAACPTEATGALVVLMLIFLFCFQQIIPLIALI